MAYTLFDQCGSLSAYDDGKGQGCHSRRAFDCWRLGNELILALYKNNKFVEKKSIKNEDRTGIK